MSVLVLAVLGSTITAGLIIWLVAGRLGVEIFPSVESGQMALRLRAPAGTKVENTEQIALRALELIKREVGSNNVAITMGLIGVHAPNYPVNLIHLWNGGMARCTPHTQLAREHRHGVGIRQCSTKDQKKRGFSHSFEHTHVHPPPRRLVTFMAADAAAIGLATWLPGTSAHMGSVCLDLPRNRQAHR